MEISFYRVVTSNKVHFPFFDHCNNIGLDLLKGDFVNIYLDWNSVTLKIIKKLKSKSETVFGE